MPTLDEGLDGGPEGAHVGPLAIDAEGAQPLKRQPLQPQPAGEHLPGREIAARGPQLVHRLEHDERIAVGRVVDGEHRGEPVLAWVPDVRPAPDLDG